MSSLMFGDFIRQYYGKETQMGMLNFDARTVAPQVGIDPVPEGWYKVVVVKSNNKAVSTGNGGMLTLELQVIEGQYQGRILYWNLNLYNTSQQAVEIAYKQLSALCHVIGQYQVTDTNTPDNMVPALHNIPFMAHAVLVQGNQGTINNIKGVRDLAGNDPGKQGAAHQGGQPQQQNPNPNPPQQNPNPPAWQPPQGGVPQPQGGAPSWQAPQGGAQQNASWTPPAGGPGGGQPAWQGGQQQNPNPPQQNPNPPAWQPPQGGAPSGQSAPWQR